MDDFAQRLSFLMHHYDLDAAALAERLQIQKSAVSHLLSGRNKPRFDILSRFALSFPDLNLRWLLTGDGEPFSPTPSESGKNESDLFSAAGIPLTPSEPVNNTKLVDKGPTKKPADKESATGNTVVNSFENKPEIAPEDAGNITELIKIYSDGTFEVLHRRKS